MSVSEQVEFPEDFIREIPKTDLHLHLDGSIRPETLIELSRDIGCALPSYTVSGLKDIVFKSEYNNLAEYLQGFKFICPVLQTPDHLERCAYELAIDNQKDGAKYIEVRFAPQLHMDSGSLDMAAVLGAVDKGLKRAETEFKNREEVLSGSEPPFHYGLIVCALRNINPGLSSYYKEFCSSRSNAQSSQLASLAANELVREVSVIRNELGLPVTAFDLAGQENGYPARKFVDSFSLAEKASLHKTVHAGEAWGPESIYQAVHDCGADRIGHGYFLFDDANVGEKVNAPKSFVRQLQSSIFQKGVTIEVCLSSNMQTNPSIQELSSHTFRNMLEDGFSTTICTDNRLISDTNLVKEYGMAFKIFIDDLEKMRNLILEGFRCSFFPGSEEAKAAYISQCEVYLDRVITKHRNEMPFLK